MIPLAALLAVAAGAATPPTAVEVQVIGGPSPITRAVKLDSKGFFSHTEPGFRFQGSAARDLTAADGWDVMYQLEVEGDPGLRAYLAHSMSAGSKLSALDCLDWRVVITLRSSEDPKADEAGNHLFTTELRDGHWTRQCRQNAKAGKQTTVFESRSRGEVQQRLLLNSQFYVYPNGKGGLLDYQLELDRGAGPFQLEERQLAFSFGKKYFKRLGPHQAALTIEGAAPRRPPAAPATASATTGPRAVSGAAAKAANPFEVAPPWTDAKLDRVLSRARKPSLEQLRGRWQVMTLHSAKASGDGSADRIFITFKKNPANEDPQDLIADFELPQATRRAAEKILARGREGGATEYSLRYRVDMERHPGAAVMVGVFPQAGIRRDWFCRITNDDHLLCRVLERGLKAPKSAQPVVSYFGSVRAPR